VVDFADQDFRKPVQQKLSKHVDSDLEFQAQSKEIQDMLTPHFAKERQKAMTAYKLTSILAPTPMIPAHANFEEFDVNEFAQQISNT